MPSIQRAPKTHWLMAPRSQLESLVICVSCFAGLNNCFKHHLALFKWENHVSIRLGKLRGVCSIKCLCRASLVAALSVGKSNVCVSYDLNMKCPHRRIKLPLLVVLSWDVLGTLVCEANLKELGHWGRSWGWHSVPGSFQYLSTRAYSEVKKFLCHVLLPPWWTEPLKP